MLIARGFRLSARGEGTVTFKLSYHAGAGLDAISDGRPWTYPFIDLMFCYAAHPWQWTPRTGMDGAALAIPRGILRTHSPRYGYDLNISDVLPLRRIIFGRSFLSAPKRPSRIMDFSYPGWKHRCVAHVAVHRFEMHPPSDGRWEYGAGIPCHRLRPMGYGRWARPATTSKLLQKVALGVLSSNMSAIGWLRPTGRVRQWSATLFQQRDGPLDMLEPLAATSAGGSLEAAGVETLIDGLQCDVLFKWDNTRSRFRKLERLLFSNVSDVLKPASWVDLEAQVAQDFALNGQSLQVVSAQCFCYGVGRPLWSDADVSCAS